MRPFHAYNKKADVVEHPDEVFGHVGLLVDEPPALPGCPSPSLPTVSLEARMDSGSADLCILWCRTERSKGGMRLRLGPVHPGGCALLPRNEKELRGLNLAKDSRQP